MVPSSSNPRRLYRQKLRAVKAHDKGDLGVIKHRGVWSALATQWQLAGDLTQNQLDEILFLLNEGPFEKVWKPLLYVIPRAGVVSKLIDVPPSKRAGIGPEYQIKGLTRSEFDVIEIDV
jgi:hypothetical protein